MKRKFIIVLFLVFGFSSFADTDDEPNVYDIQRYNFPRQIGSGGPHVTQEDGFYTLFTNPALFAHLTRQWHISSLMANRKFGTDSTKQNYKISTDIYGPLCFGFLDENFAIGILNNTKIKNQNTPRLYFFGEELVVIGGYGAKVYETELHTISLGIQMKADFLVAAFTNSPSDNGNEFTPFSSLGDNPPINFVTGLGFDVGFLYDYNDFIRLGLTIHDLYTLRIVTRYTTFDEFKPGGGAGSSEPIPTYVPNISIGISVSPSLPGHYRTFTGYTFWAEYNNILSALNAHPNPTYYDIVFGMEFEFNQAYRLRLGFKELAPTVGIGIDMGYFSVDGSFAVTQQSPKPWTSPGLEVGVSFSAKM